MQTDIKNDQNGNISPQPEQADGQSPWQTAFYFIATLMRVMRERNIGLLSAGVAFFALLALFPGIAALISIFGAFADPLVIEGQLIYLQDFVPPAAYALITNQITRLVGANDGTLGWAGLVSVMLALFLARRGVDALLIGINAIHAKPHRSGLSHAIRVLAMTLGMVLAGVVALLSFLILPVLLAFFPIAGLQGILVDLARWALSLGMVAGWVWLFYHIGPNRPRSTRPRRGPGLLLAMTLWVSASAGFSYYLTNFSNYNEVYGSIGAVIALLMWFYLSAYSVLIGGVLNATLEAQQSDRKSHPATART